VEVIGDEEGGKHKVMLADVCFCEEEEKIKKCFPAEAGTFSTHFSLYHPHPLTPSPSAPRHFRKDGSREINEEHTHPTREKGNVCCFFCFF